MPNFKIFQDNPDQARVKIYGNKDIAINEDFFGNIGITASGLAVTGIIDVGTVTVTTGAGQLSVCISQSISVTTGSGSLSVCIGTGALTVTIPESISVTTGSGSLSVCIGTGALTVTIPESISVTTGSGSLSVCIGTGALTVTIPESISVTTGSGSLSVCIGTGALTVTIPESISVTTGSGSLSVCIGTGQLSVSLDQLGTTEITENVTTASTSYSGASPQVILNQNAWTFAVKNTSLANAQALAQVQLSATAATESDWLQDVIPVTLNQNSLAFLTTSLLMKYARVYYAAVNSASLVALNIIFVAQK
jgi:hypothetical protein